MIKSEIVHGWHAIALYIGKSERTARRWADNFRFPVRHTVAGRPFILPHEIDRWFIFFDELSRKHQTERTVQRCEHARRMRAAKKGVLDDNL